MDARQAHDPRSALKHQPQHVSAPSKSFSLATSLSAVRHRLRCPTSHHGRQPSRHRCAHRALQHHSITTTATTTCYMDGTCGQHRRHRCADRALQHHSIATTATTTWYMDSTCGQHSRHHCTDRALQHHSIATTATTTWYMDGTCELEPVLPLHLRVYSLGV